ncbi:MAG TPA: SurA N-terminal domain-containing protein, partial [Deinococcales bacterium]|nr:SurA N-terminal domain-containing protein [Deinococcales bacterium]
MNKKTNTVILWLIAIGLLLGMIITFTPNLGFGGSNVTSAQGDVVMRVNGEPITDLEINQLRNSNPLYYAVTEGEVGADLELLALDAVITQELLRQAAASQRVSNSEVKEAVNAFREDRGVAGGRNDSAYVDLLAASGFDDSSFRAYMK